MVKLILVPKFDQQCARRIAADAVCVNMLPMNTVVRISICQDGRCPSSRTNLQHEAEYFEGLYNDYNKLDMPKVKVICSALSFASSPDTLRNHLNELETCDIFFMTGFTPGQSISHQLKTVFHNHARRGPCERDQSCGRQNLVRAIVARVQYNQMVFMGACGGAMCAGKNLLLPLEPKLELFDFCKGVSIRYDACMLPNACNANVIDRWTFLITRGAGLAVHIEHDIVAASSFPAIKNNTWWEWCQRASTAHETVVRAIAKVCTGPWWCEELGIWYFCLNGSLRCND